MTSQRKYSSVVYLLHRVLMLGSVSHLSITSHLVARRLRVPVGSLASATVNKWGLLLAALVEFEHVWSEAIKNCLRRLGRLFAGH